MPDCNKIFYYRASLRKHIETSHLNYVLENNIKDPYTEVIEVLKQNHKAPSQHTEQQPEPIIQNTSNNNMPIPITPITPVPNPETLKIMSGSTPHTIPITYPANQLQKPTIDNTDVTLLVNKWPQEPNSPAIKFISH
jgi:hypothetical protein